MFSTDISSDIQEHVTVVNETSASPKRIIRKRVTNVSSANETAHTHRKLTRTNIKLVPNIQIVNEIDKSPDRPRRTICKPIRYRHCDSHDTGYSGSSDSSFYKVKKVLAQRGQGNKLEYLIHFKGEPAQNAMWLPFNCLNSCTKRIVLENPPVQL